MNRRFLSIFGKIKTKPVTGNVYVRENIRVTPFPNFGYKKEFGSANFERNSIAYGDNFESYDINRPRFKQGKFYQGILIEEGTENLLTEDQSNLSLDWAINGSESEGFTASYDSDNNKLNIETIFTANGKFYLNLGTSYPNKDLSASIQKIEVTGLTSGSIKLVLEDQIPDENWIQVFDTTKWVSETNYSNVPYSIFIEEPYEPVASSTDEIVRDSI